MNPVPATKVKNLFVDTVPHGAFKIEGKYLHTLCPCGCRTFRSLPIKLRDELSLHKTAWEWDGDVDHPTLTPSIRDLGDCHFHGFLTAGVWTFCEDSGA